MSSILINGFKCEVLETENEFYQIKYNDIEITISPDKTKFNANLLFTKLGGRKVESKSTYLKSFFKRSDIETFQNLYPEWFKMIEGDYFISFELLSVFSTYCNPVAGLLWFINKDWNTEAINKGYIYLVQTSNPDHVKTNTYKVGQAFNPNRRFPEYGPEMKCFGLQSVKDRFKAEDLLKSSFRAKFERASKSKISEGKEYFHCDNVEEAIELFNKVVKKCKNKGLIEEIVDESSKFTNQLQSFLKTIPNHKIKFASLTSLYNQFFGTDYTPTAFSRIKAIRNNFESIPVKKKGNKTITYYKLKSKEFESNDNDINETDSENANFEKIEVSNTDS